MANSHKFPHYIDVNLYKIWHSRVPNLQRDKLTFIFIKVKKWVLCTYTESNNKTYDENNSFHIFINL